MARSTFYYYCKALQRPDKHEGNKERILALFSQHKGRYGYRRITLALRQEGVLLNHKTVYRLMKTLQIKSVIRVKRYRSYRGAVGKVAPNRLQRQFSASRPNEKWVTDVTEFNVAGERLYLSPILDLYNGEIVAHHTSKHPRFDMVANMLDKAFLRLSKEEHPVLHSDQGWQYQMPAYQGLLHEQGVISSMSRKGNCLDNAPMESFFGTLKSECFYLQKFSSIEQLQEAINEYIQYYNHERIKLKLNGLSPVNYRTQSISSA